MPTIRDIARQAGVSVGTVSNYLNNPDIVAEKSRQPIEDAIRILGYHPHAAARSLKSNQTNRIGLVPLISPEHNRSMEPGDLAFLEFLSAINTRAAELGYAVLMQAATRPEDELHIYQRLIGERQVDGLVLMGLQARDPRVMFLLEHKFPFVTFGRSGISAHAFVDADNPGGIAQALEHLAGLGHQRIAMITPPAHLRCSADRKAGYLDNLNRLGLPFEPDWLVEGDFSEQAGQIAMHLLLDLPHPPSAVITANDFCAFGVLRALTHRGLQAGRDFSVVGFDDIRLASHWNPALTTIRQPFRQMGMQAVEALVSRINGSSELMHRICKTELVIRSTTGPWKE